MLACKLKIWYFTMMILIVGNNADKLLHGVRESTLSKPTVKFSTELTFRSCGIEIEGGYIDPDSCRNDIDIISITGISSSCKQISKHQLFGPVRISGPDCQQTVFGADACDRAVLDKDRGVLTCPNHSSTLAILVIILMLTVTIVTLTSMRYLYIRKWFTFKQHKIISSTEGIINFTHKMKRTDFAETKLFERQEEAQILHDNVFNITFKPWTLLLTILFITAWIKPTTSDYIKTIPVSSGDVIHMSDGSLIIDESYESFPLEYEYDTGSFHTELFFSSICTEKHCNDMGLCDVASHGLIPNGLNMWREGKERVFNGRHCKFEHMTGCIFARGCNRLFIKFHIPDSGISEVFSPGQPSLITNITAVGSPECEVIGHSIDEPFLMSKYTIIQRDGGHSICPLPTNRFRPVSDTLGDLQLSHGLNSTAYNYDWSSVKCHLLWETEANCGIKPSFMHKIENLCHKLPMMIGSALVSVSSGSLIVKRDNVANIQLKCSRHPQFEMINSTCGDFETQVWGIEGSGFPIQYLVRSKTIRLSTDSHVIIPCTGENVNIKCDGKFHFFNIPSTHLCKELMNADVYQVAEQGYQGLTEDDVIIYRDSPHGGNILSGLGSFFSSSLGKVMGGSMGSLVLIGAVALLLAKR